MIDNIRTICPACQAFTILRIYDMRRYKCGACGAYLYPCAGTIHIERSGDDEMERTQDDEIRCRAGGGKETG